jgi:drug/metabolite transporter superfamily protein YnfA
MKISPLRALAALAVPLALLVGIYARFKGLGEWPLGVDEFYISRSIDHVLATGLPAFPCGGYYTRGILFQYAVAALRGAGATPEFAGRFIAASCSLAVLPAAFLIGRRLHGSLAGWLTVVILCLSIWEIETARFGRMYAPFQAVFVWYVVFYLRFTVDKHARALWGLIGLSILGVLTWEGGTLLGVASLYAVLQARDRANRLSAREWLRLLGLLFLLALLYAATLDQRGFAPSAEGDVGQAAGDGGTGQFLRAIVAPLGLHPVWACAFSIPLAFTGWWLRALPLYSKRELTILGQCIVLALAAAHVFLAAAGILALLLLLGLADRRELASERKRYLVLAALSFLIAWLAFALFSTAQLGKPGVAAMYPSTAFPIIQALFGYPDILQRILWPWGRVMPMWFIVLVFGVLFWCVKTLRAPTKRSDPATVLIGLLLLLVLAVGAIPTNRIETRYTFFLYPLLVIFAVSAILSLSSWLKLRRPASLLMAALALLCFAGTEDFRIHQVLHIDSAANNFRIGMSAARTDHYYPRNDMRGVGAWLQAHVRPGDIVISGIPNLDQYYSKFDYFYLDAPDEDRYDAYLCPDARTDRWTNHPILYEADSLRPLIHSSHRVYALLYPDVETRLKHDAQLLGWTLTRTYLSADSRTEVVEMEMTAAESGTQ